MTEQGPPLESGAIDPVCGMQVPVDTRYRTGYLGLTVLFC